MEDVENSVVNRPDYRTANPTQKNKMLNHAAEEWIIGHPGEFVSLGLKRLSRTFIQRGDIDYAFYGSGLSSLLQTFLSLFSELVRMPMFLVGIASIVMHTLIYLYLIVENRQPKRKTWFALSSSVDKGSLFLMITFFMFAGVYFITEGQNRYAFPTVLSLTFYAVMGIERVKKMRG